MSPQQVPLTAQETQGVASLGTQEGIASVQKFDTMEKGDLLLEYTKRNGKLIFHVYHKERKHLVDTAQEEASRNDSPRHLRMLDAQLTDALEKHPWWDNVGQCLVDTFSSFFHNNVKVVFDPEVDSWSVSLPFPEIITAWSDQTKQLLLERLYACLTMG